MPSDQEVKNILKKITSIESSISLYQKEKSILESQIKSLKDTKEDLRKCLMDFMHDENITVYVDGDFGELSIRKSSDKYVIKDEEELMIILKKYDRLDDLYENTVKLNKRRLNGFLNELKNCDSLPKCIEIEKGSDSIVFKPKNFSVINDDAAPVDSITNVRDDNFSLEEWDSI